MDSRFICLWIGFNAIYAKDVASTIHTPERGVFIEYLRQLCKHDGEQRIYSLIWQTFSNSIRVLLTNQYTFQPFWDYQNGIISETAWQADFAANQRRALTALADNDTDTVLLALFKHLYTLRNQLIHGGATHGSHVNREQLRDAVQILSDLVPAMIWVMLEHPTLDWGKPYYPVIN